MYSWATVGGHGGRFKCSRRSYLTKTPLVLKGDVVRYGRATGTFSGGDDVMFLKSSTFY